MLLEFRVANFRSFAGEQKLSLVASADKELLEVNTAPTGIKVLPRAVRSAVIYGANASGKSNLVKALQMMQSLVLNSTALKPDQPFEELQPFRLSKTGPQDATLFEVTVILGGVRHQYGFQVTRERVIHEWLLVYKTRRPAMWFERTVKDGKDVYTTSDYLTGNKATWQEATRSNVLFLTNAVQLNSEVLRPLYLWFAQKLVILGNGGLIPFDFSTNIAQSSEGASAIAGMLRSADIGIEAISTTKRKGFRRQIQFNLQTGDATTSQHERELIVPMFRHRSGEICAEFEYNDESDGTKKLFSLAGPLMDIVNDGKVLVVDELDNSLHPLLVRQIVGSFHTPESAKQCAQLVFTTHDTSLLDGDLLRRDQVWLTEKTREQSTQLVALTEFSPRKGEALERGYLGGRYGGIPIVDNRLKAVTGDKE